MARTRRRRLVALVLAAVLTLTGCAQLVDGTGQVAAATLAVQGDSGGTFDTEVKNALSDVIAFWQQAYPGIAHGASLPPLRGKLYSVDGDAVLSTRTAPTYARANKCLRRQLSFIVDNAAYCPLDDSIIWDRANDHLLPVLTREYGSALTALVFAHEFGHAIQNRLGLNKLGVPTIDLESQADCAAGAFAAAALTGQAVHFHITAAELDRAVGGYFQIRDSTPGSAGDISHGNGFDRLNALEHGITSGPSYCYSPTYLSTRTFTERPYASDKDYAAGGNQPLSAELGKSGIGPDLNRFWTSAATGVHKTFRAVQLSSAANAACGNSTSELGYCPANNTVYYSPSFARQAYYSITTITVSPHTAAVTLERNQPADFALGMLLSIAWGMAARHQFFAGSTEDRAGLLAGICFAGAYAENINRQTSDKAHPYILSPPDMDEATFAVLNLVQLPQAFGGRGTSGLQRVRAFVTGYAGGLRAC